MITIFFLEGGGGGDSTPQIPYIEPCKLEHSARNANTVKSEPLLRSHLSRNHFPQLLHAKMTSTKWSRPPFLQSLGMKYFIVSSPLLGGQFDSNQ